MQDPRSKLLVGGCQCGAVRYRAEGQPRKVHYCHCRMCQRAVGNVFAAFVPIRKDQLTWEGTPSLFRSSSIAERGFCSRCGTPLSFAYDKSGWICLALGSLDEPTAVRPEAHYGIESQVPWLHFADDLPRERTNESEVSGMINCQHSPA